MSPGSGESLQAQGFCCKRRNTGTCCGRKGYAGSRKALPLILLVLSDVEVGQEGFLRDRDRPICFIFFLPSFCFSSSFLFRVMSRRSIWPARPSVRASHSGARRPFPDGGLDRNLEKLARDQFLQFPDNGLPHVEGGILVANKGKGIDGSRFTRTSTLTSSAAVKPTARNRARHTRGVVDLSLSWKSTMNSARGRM